MRGKNVGVLGVLSSCRHNHEVKRESKVFEGRRIEDRSGEMSVVVLLCTREHSVAA